jgi:hypothetical protein
MTTPPSTPKRKASTSPNTSRKVAKTNTPKTKSIISGLGKMSMSPDTARKYVKSVKRSLAENLNKASRSAILAKGVKGLKGHHVKTPFQIRNELQKKTSKNKNTSKK